MTGRQHDNGALALAHAREFVSILDSVAVACWTSIDGALEYGPGIDGALEYGPGRAMDRE